MSITTLQAWQVSEIETVAKNNETAPEAIWSVLANWGDTYARAAWTGLTLPDYSNKDYRFTLEVETPVGLTTGSGVIENWTRESAPAASGVGA